MTTDRKQERRRRQHAAIRAEIKATARAHMARDGAAALSLRAVAAEMGLSSAAIYYYYPNRDGLITDMIVDAYRALRAALEAAREAHASAPIAEQTMAALLAYRAWAIANPAEYALLFGTPIPGYVGPTEITAPEVQATLTVIGELLAEAEQAGQLSLDLSRLPESVSGFVGGWIEALGPRPSPAVLVATLRIWSAAHGLVGLELDSHLQPVIGDSAAFYAFEMRALLRSIGVAAR